MEGDDDWTQPNDPIQDIMAGLAAARPCRYHGPDAACDRCPAGYDTDAQGFPHPRAVARGVRRLRHCPRCGELVTPEQWDTRPTARKPYLGPWQCLQCSAAEASECRHCRTYGKRCGIHGQPAAPAEVSEAAPEGDSACEAGPAKRSTQP